MPTHNIWLNTEQCRHLSLLEAAIVQQLPEIQHLSLAVVVGEGEQINWMRYMTANHVYYKTMGDRREAISDQDLIIKSPFYEFPFLPKTLNVAILPHTLKYCMNPGHLLANLTPCLRDDGYLVLFLFERFSPLSCRQKMRKDAIGRVCPYFHSNFWIKRHLKEWNYLLLRESKYFFNLPKAGSHPMLKWLSFIGDVRMLLVKRQEICITPLQERWRDKQWGQGVVTLKSNSHNKDVGS